MTGSVISLVGALASVATAIGVILAAVQLLLAKRQGVTDFEDSLSAQYRQIARRLPLEALLGEQVDEVRYQQSLPDFYHYLDLSNEQAFLRLQGRIRSTTWANWLEGIQQNLRRPAFARAWREISTRAPESFNELRQFTPPNLEPAEVELRPGRQAIRTADRVKA